jgi:hypothetical protein
VTVAILAGGLGLTACNNTAPANAPAQSADDDGGFEIDIDLPGKTKTVTPTPVRPVPRAIPPRTTAPKTTATKTRTQRSVGANA